jgi:hypothetical protein
LLLKIMDGLCASALALVGTSKGASKRRKAAAADEEEEGNSQWDDGKVIWGPFEGERGVVGAWGKRM